MAHVILSNGESQKLKNRTRQMLQFFLTAYTTVSNNCTTWTWNPGSVSVYMNECSTGYKSTVRSQAKSDNVIKKTFLFRFGYCCQSLRMLTFCWGSANTNGPLTTLSQSTYPFTKELQSRFKILSPS